MHLARPVGVYVARPVEDPYLKVAALARLSAVFPSVWETTLSAPGEMAVSAVFVVVSESG